MELRQEVERVLEERVQPMLMEHGGAVRLLDCADGVVSVELLGACSGCPSADLSTRGFIEDTLRAELPEVERVRLGSLEPEQMELPVLERLARQEKLCPQFHLSLQSGCDATLKRMNRHYTAAEYESIVNNIRGVFDNPSVTTDMMVGFAGETPEDFEESLNFARKIGFAKVHVFAYSRRPGTAADRMPGQVPNKVKEERSRQLIEATNEARRRFLLTQVGRTEPVLFESKRLEDYYEGYTANYTPVHVQSPIPLFGKILPVKILEAGEDFCFGSLI